MGAGDVFRALNKRQCRLRNPHQLYQSQHLDITCCRNHSFRLDVKEIMGGKFHCVLCDPYIVVQSGDGKEGRGGRDSGYARCIEETSSP